MTSKRTRRKFSKSFKQEAVRLCEKRTVSEAAASLGLAPEMLYRWRRQCYEEGQEAFRGNGNRTALEEEIRRLRKENADLKEEQEILKKASAYFARSLL